MSEKNADGLFGRQVPLGVTVMLAFGMTAGGGGVGSYVTGSNMKTELKVTQTLLESSTREVLGKIEELRSQVGREGARVEKSLQDHENRIRKLEEVIGGR